MLHRRTKNNARAFIIGMLLALLLTQPVAAQFTVNINSDTSPTTFQGLQLMGQQLASQVNIAADSKQSRIAQALEHIKTAQRWVESVEQYTNMILSNVRRFTSLKGILSTVEKTLGLSDDTLKALRDIGEVIRGAITLKNSFLSLVRTRLAMIESLAARARAGIFNPEADLRDLEEYLLYSLGREAGARLASRQRLAEIDPLIERLTYELQKVRAERAAKITELTNIKAQLEREGGLQANARTTGVDDNGASTTVFGDKRQSLSPDAVQTLTLRAGQLEQQIAWYDEQDQINIANQKAMMQAGGTQQMYDSQMQAAQTTFGGQSAAAGITRQGTLQAGQINYQGSMASANFQLQGQTKAAEITRRSSNSR